MVIAVDAMGGDIPVHAPVEAAVRAANDFEQEIILSETMTNWLLSSTSIPSPKN